MPGKNKKSGKRQPGFGNKSNTVGSTRGHSSKEHSGSKSGSSKHKSGNSMSGPGY